MPCHDLTPSWTFRILRWQIIWPWYTKALSDYMKLSMFRVTISTLIICILHKLLLGWDWIWVTTVVLVRSWSSIFFQSWPDLKTPQINSWFIEDSDLFKGRGEQSIHVQWHLVELTWAGRRGSTCARCNNSKWQPKPPDFRRHTIIPNPLVNQPMNLIKYLFIRTFCIYILISIYVDHVVE